MRQIVIISGKGGTGKTVLAASFVALAKNKVIVDCDVDAADLHLLLHPTIKQRYEFRSGRTAKIDKKICEQCGKCIVACRFSAIGGSAFGGNAISKDFTVDPISCEGCALCSNICPVNAISMQESLSGEWFISETKYGIFVHAKLGIAEENSGKLVAKEREVAKDIAQKQNNDYVIIDGPPGIGCPVIASLSGVDFALIVTEPTLSAIHDMQRVMDVAGHFKISSKVVINKYDLNLKNTHEIEAICRDKQIEVLGQIPFSRKVSESIVKSLPIVECIKDGVSEEIISIWEKIERI